MKSSNMPIENIHFTHIKCNQKQINELQTIAGPCKLQIDLNILQKLDTSKKGKNIQLSGNNLIATKPAGSYESVLCYVPIPLEGTHSFTARHATSNGNTYCYIGVANTSINLACCPCSNAWTY